jgi:hypothetical protein
VVEASKLENFTDMTTDSIEYVAKQLRRVVEGNTIKVKEGALAEEKPKKKKEKVGKISPGDKMDYLESIDKMERGAKAGKEKLVEDFIEIIEVGLPCVFGTSNAV